MVTTRAKDAKTLFPPTMAYMSELASAQPVFQPIQLKNQRFRNVLFCLYSSKIKDSETYCFDTLTTQYDYPRYVKHVLGCTYVFFNDSGGGGGSPGGAPHGEVMALRPSQWVGSARPGQGAVHRHGVVAGWHGTETPRHYGCPLRWTQPGACQRTPPPPHRRNGR